VPFDDDAEADHPGFRPPPHPDDRIWRHPSEMSAHPIVPVGAPAAQPLSARLAATQRGTTRGGRPWGAVMVAGTVGAVLAGAGVVALGIGERVVERPVTERVALNPTASAIGAPDAGTLDAVRQTVEPAVVGIEAPGAQPGQGEIAGSGVVVRDDGMVITSASLVVAGSANRVRLPGGTVVTAEMVGSDPTTGLAMLDLAGGRHTPSVLATSADVVAGETSFAVSVAPSGGSTTAAGVVGRAQRYLGPTGSALDGIEVEGEADPLAIGGPVVNSRGAVVGIVTAVEDGGAWYVAPVEVAHRVADGLLTEGVVRHCWLGIEGTDVAPGGTDGTGGTDPDIAEPGSTEPGSTEPGSTEAGTLATTEPTDGGGTRVASVVAGSPAARGGLRSGDVVVALDGQTIARMPDLIVALRSRSPGDRINVTVIRDGGSRATLVLTLAEAPTPTP
jgi:S1-C subfamily serine protease